MKAEGRLAVELKQISRFFYADEPVLQNLTLQVRRGEWVAILGPSGSGKTTLFNLIASLDSVNEGTCWRDMNMRLGYMLQEPVLLPWRTLGDNATLGVEVVSGFRPDPAAWFERTALSNYQHYLPESSSLGMRQRVAFVRTLMLEPDLLLLDEPFSALDLEMKLLLQADLIASCRTNRHSVMLVTHDVDDAVALADRVVVLSARPATIVAVLPGLAGFSGDPLALRASAGFREVVAEVWRVLGEVSGRNAR